MNGSAATGVKGPDFLGIGAARSGTSWLYRALERHRALWLPPIKELHYFDNPLRNQRYSQHLRKRLIAGLRMQRPLSSWDLHYFLGRRSDDWYCGLFEPGHRRGLITGEITPAYSVVDERMLARIQALNPRVKLIFSMRDPVMRTWSNVMKNMKRRGAAGLPSLDLALRLSSGPGDLKRARYSDIIESLERVFERDQIFYMFFEDLLERPEVLVTNVLRFLGAEPGDVAPLLPSGPVNAGAAGRKPPLEFERALAASFLPDVCKLGERFEGPPHAWRARYDALLDGRAGPRD